MRPLAAIPADQDAEQSGRPSLSHSSVAQIEAALDHILVSAPFKNSQQAQRLLRYIVERSLAHEEHLLRERVIGSVIFGRPPDYDTGGDPIVRIRAAEVRKRLAQYYQTFAHDEADVAIEIPSGCYRAVFRPRREAAGAAHLTEEISATRDALNVGSTEVLPAIRGHRDRGDPARPSLPQQGSIPLPMKRFSTSATVVCLLFAVVVAAGLWWHAHRDSPSAVFWRPWTSSSKPVLIAIGSNAVYRFSDQLTSGYQRSHHLEAFGQEFFVPLTPDETVKGKDIVPAENSFVALGDVAAASAIVATLTTQRQAFQERFPNDISFAELRNSPSVLIGGFNNPMTIELTKNLPFVLRQRNEIDDTRHNRRWVLHASEDSHDTEDYALITRLVQRGGDGAVLCVAGMGQYGTLAAANFIVNPTALAEYSKKLPADWARQNLQILLHLKVVDFKPTSIEVVGSQVW